MFKTGLINSSAFSSAIRRGLSTNNNKKHFILQYHYVANMLEKRAPHREAHLTYANGFVQQKILKAGGALVPEVVQGILLFEASDRSVVEEFAKHDPYVTTGLVTKYEISEWAIAVGKV